ncbi:MAG: multicopper oxidase family protein, partial [Alphaproteobacteria bacterium]|nr:multicopper oxidase family protein [Alphaproteobacteria bacterium]
LRVKQGDALSVSLHNRLPQETSIHWHGIRLPNAMDGVSGLTQDPVGAGANFDYRFELPDAGTYCYHTHNRSWEQMARGLYGMLVVEEADPPQADRDLAFIVDDWRLDNRGQIDGRSFGAMPDWAHAGRLGNWVTVNGKPGPVLKVRAGERIRLRVLNAANARIFQLAFPGLRPWVMALDGQPIAPWRSDPGPLTLAPGQRVDLLIDMTGGPETASPVRALFPRQVVDIAKFAYGPEDPLRRAGLGPPAPLAANPLPGPLSLKDAVVAPLRMEGGAMGGMMGAMMGGRMHGMRSLMAEGKVWAFNGVAGLPDRPLVTVRRGQTVRIDMDNANRWPHAMHLHGQHFKVVHRNGTAVEGSPWRDTELVQPGERVSIAFIAAAPGKWLLHCHMLEHQAGGMSTWIEVT